VTTSNDHPGVLDARRRTRGPACVSALTLDRFALGELEGGQREAVSAHLAGCADCTRAHQALSAEQALFVQEAPIANLAADALARAQRQPSRWSWRRLVAPLSLAAVGVGALVFFVTPREGTRTKGEFSLSPYVLHPESTAPGSLHLGEPLHPGDKLQFRYNGNAGYLTVVAIDSKGDVSVYYPPGPTAAPVPAGRDIALASAVELDATLGREVIIGVRCETPVAVTAVAESARKAVEGARGRGLYATEIGALDFPCAQTRHQITKQPRPTP
jgi:hypothetical protein